MVSASDTSGRPRLTIFTPTYNRAKLLPRLFESIRSSRHQVDFLEWLLVDDGSLDGTAEIVRSFQAAEPGLIRYVRVQNGGKHRAISRAAELARGDWILLLDSDDYVAPGAIARIQRRIEAVDCDEQVGVLRALRTFPDAPASHRFLLDEQPSYYSEWLARQSGFDSAEVVRKTALAQHPFPDFEGERFMAEGWLWHRLDTTHRTIFVNDSWIVCFYQVGGLTAKAAALRANCPQGATAVYAEILSAGLPLHARLRASINWWRYRFHARRMDKQGTPAPGAHGILAPVGWLIYCLDCFNMARMEP